MHAYTYIHTSIKGTLCKSFPTIPQRSGDFSEVKMLKIMPFRAVGILIGSFEKCNFSKMNEARYCGYTSSNRPSFLGSARFCGSFDVF